MTNLDLANYDLGSLETTFAVTKQMPDGRQVVIEADTDAAHIEQLRKQHEEREAAARFRVYRVALDVREQSRTVLPGDLRYELVERTKTVAGKERKEWTVERVGGGKLVVTQSITNEEHAQLVCDLQNKLPEGYTAYYESDLRDHIAAKSLGPGAKVVYYADYTPDSEDDWRVTRVFEQLDLVLRDVESHHATEDERRAKYAAKLAAAEKAKADRRFKVEAQGGRRVWFFMPAKATEIADGDDSIWITAKGKLVIEDWDEVSRVSTFRETDAAGAADWFVNHGMDPAEHGKAPKELLNEYANREG